MLGRFGMTLKKAKIHMKRRIRLILAVLFLGIGTPLQAADTGADVGTLEKQIDGVRQEVAKTENARNLSEFITRLSTIQDSIVLLKNQAQEQLETVGKKLQALGDAPTDGQTEPTQLATQRRTLGKEQAETKALLARSDLALAKIDEINGQIVRKRNAALVSMLTYRQQPIWDVKNFGTSLVGFLTFFYNVLTAPADWYRALDAEKRNLLKTRGIDMAFLGGFVLMAAAFLSLLIRRYFGYRSTQQMPTYAKKTTSALMMFLARAVIPATVLGTALFFLYRYRDFVNGPFGISLRLTLIYALYFLICGVGISVLLLPRHTAWRLIEVSDKTARRLNLSLLSAVFLIGLFSYFHTLAVLLNQTPDVLYALRVLSNAVKAGCIAFVAAQFVTLSAPVPDTGDTSRQSFGFGSKTAVFLIFAAAVVFGFSVFGYIRLSEFILDRFLFSVLVFGIFYIVRRFLLGLFHHVATRAFWRNRLNLSDRLIGQTEFWIGLLITPVLLILCGLILMAVWGASVDVLLQNTKKFLTGFDIGGMHISIVSIILGIVTFFICLALIRVFKASLLNGRLQYVSPDANIRGSLAAGVGFFGIVLSVLFSIAVMGGSLQGIALIAGGLSIGAGLGLQNIINNFVSGLILLFERPIKIGDIVNINGYEGTVRQINMRSTQVELWNRANVIIPNADILSQSVVNMTYKNRLARADIVIDVDWDSDPMRVEQLLLDIARGVGNVAAHPEPFVIFSDIAEGRLRFQVSCYTADISNRIGISNKIRAGILTRFKEEGISLFVPQRVISVQNNATDKGKPS